MANIKKIGIIFTVLLSIFTLTSCDWNPFAKKPTNDDIKVFFDLMENSNRTFEYDYSIQATFLGEKVAKSTINVKNIYSGNGDYLKQSVAKISGNIVKEEIIDYRNDKDSTTRYEIDYNIPNSIWTSLEEEGKKDLSFNLDVQGVKKYFDAGKYIYDSKKKGFVITDPATFINIVNEENEEEKIISVDVLITLSKDKKQLNFNIKLTSTLNTIIEQEIVIYDKTNILVIIPTVG